jgi:hypothetical protein
MKKCIYRFEKNNEYYGHRNLFFRICPQNEEVGFINNSSAESMFLLVASTCVLGVFRSPTQLFYHQELSTLHHPILSPIEPARQATGCFY